MLPNIIGRYTVQQQIGHGGMAFVYLAHDPNLNDRVVAIKILKEQHQDARFQHDFQKEAHMLAALAHPNILPIYEYGDDNCRSYIVMRYIANGSLKHRLQQAIFSPQEASDILTDIASALDYTHSEGIIHRDIKLSNILLDERNIPLLADFGIGRLVDDTDTVTDIGSPPYMAPEQWDRQKIDERTDVYQLGLMLFEMLTGRRPFPPGRKDEYRHHHLSTPIPPIHRVNSQLSPRFDAIIQKAAHKKPARRYQSAGEFAEAFALAVEQSHDDNTVTEPDTRPSKRNNYRWMGAGGILLLMLMLAFLFGDKLQGIVTVPVTPSPTRTPVIAVADGAVATIPTAPLATETPTPTSTPLPDTPVPTPTQPMPTDTITPAPTSTPSLTPTPLPTITPLPTPTTDPYQLPLNPTAGSPWVREQDGMPMRFVPGGNLSLGASDADQDALRTHCERMGIASNCPERIVDITSPPYTAIVSAYWIDANEVTNGQYAICVADTICQPVTTGNDVEAAHDNYPVVNVNWDQARAYCEWAGGDLPSEAQWEYAARGPMQSLFPWGSKFDASNGNFCDKNCTYGYREEGGDDGHVVLAETGAYPNGHSWVNVANMAGNAGEWTLASSDDGQDTHMIRGGSWASYSDAMSTVSHIMLSPTAANTETGFRCVLPALP